MALKALLLRNKITAAEKQLAALREKDKTFETREAELTASVNELGGKPDATEEERKAVDDAVDAFDKERTDHEAEKTTLTDSIKTLNDELAAAEAEQPNPAAAEPAPAEATTEGRKTNMNYEKRSYKKMTEEQRSAFVQRDKVKAFCESIRSLKKTRAVSGTELVVPEEVMPLLIDAYEQYSKLLKHVNAQPVKGKARVRVLGAVPEAVWMEMGGKLNELALSFTGVDVDGYKVGGFFVLPDWVMEDNDVTLMGVLLTTLGQSIGLGIDKAIPYGTGAKMPMGIVTRLVQTAAPADGSAHMDAVAWKDLHTTNVITITSANSTGVKLFQNILKAAGAAKANYSNGQKFWIMNDTTLSKLKAEAMSFNAAGVIVSGMDSTMPVLGGAVETLSFMPDDVIIGGYGDLYFIAERSGATMNTSDQVKFIEDQTVAKGVARLDGQPTIPNAFVAIGINDAVPVATAVTFAADAANA